VGAKRRFLLPLPAHLRRSFGPLSLASLDLLEPEDELASGSRLGAGGKLARGRRLVELATRASQWEAVVAHAGKHDACALVQHERA